MFLAQDHSLILLKLSAVLRCQLHKHADLFDKSVLYKALLESDYDLLVKLMTKPYIALCCLRLTSQLISYPLLEHTDTRVNSFALDA